MRNHPPTVTQRTATRPRRRQKVHGTGRRRSAALWAALNTPFVLWLLSSVVVAGLGTWWSGRAARTEAERTRVERLQLLQLELTLRSVNLAANLAGDDPSAAPGERVRYVFRVFRKTGFLAAPAPEYGSLPDFRDRSAISLLTEFGALEPRATHDTRLAVGRLQGLLVLDPGESLLRYSAKADDDVVFVVFEQLPRVITSLGPFLDHDLREITNQELHRTVAMLRQKRINDRQPSSPSVRP
jgi:hypothetical protein